MKKVSDIFGPSRSEFIDCGRGDCIIIVKIPSLLYQPSPIIDQIYLFLTHSIISMIDERLKLLPVCYSLQTYIEGLIIICTEIEPFVLFAKLNWMEM